MLLFLLVSTLAVGSSAFHLAAARPLTPASAVRAAVPTAVDSDTLRAVAVYDGAMEQKVGEMEAKMKEMQGEMEKATQAADLAAESTAKLAIANAEIESLNKQLEDAKTTEKKLANANSDLAELRVFLKAQSDVEADVKEKLSASTAEVASLQNELKSVKDDLAKAQAAAKAD